MFVLKANDLGSGSSSSSKDELKVENLDFGPSQPMNHCTSKFMSAGKHVSLPCLRMYSSEALHQQGYVCRETCEPPKPQDVL